MDPVADSLAEFYTEEEIRGFWKQAADALLTRATKTVHITGTAQEGRSANAIVLNSPEEIGQFIKSCKAALNLLNASTATPKEQLGVGTDFSHRAVRT